MLARHHTPLNGFSANTESGRLRQLTRNCYYMSQTVSGKGNLDSCKEVQTVQPPITPAESSRIASLAYVCGGSPSGAVTQSRAKELLAAAGSRQQFGSETVRIERRMQETIACSTDPFDSETRFSQFNRLPAREICPPLPPPPAPPAKNCPLEKNKKF
jgi:hypothetical protein